jgi:hypothetical protein
MKKERPEFTILRYLGRPPSLFNDDAIAAVRTILEDTPNFNWDTFTEYAIFHKLSQTLYPNMKQYGQASCPPSSRPTKKIPDKENKIEKLQGNSSNSTFSIQHSALRIPSKVVNKFRGIFLANAARNEFLAQELIKTNRLLNANGIEMLNWKGPTLAIQAYGDLSLRQFMDIDTLCLSDISINHSRHMYLSLLYRFMIKMMRLLMVNYLMKSN